MTDGLSRRGFLGFLFALFVFVMGCGKKETPRSVEKPPVIPVPAPSQTPPAGGSAPELKFARIPEFSRPEQVKPSVPSVPVKVSLPTELVLRGSETEIMRQTETGVPLVHGLINGIIPSLTVKYPSAQNTVGQLTMDVVRNPARREQHLRLASDDGKGMRATSSLDGIAFYNADGTLLLDQNKKPIQLRLKEILQTISQKDGWRRLLEIGTLMFLVALPVWLGVKALGAVVVIIEMALSAIAFLASFAIYLAFFAVASALAMPAIRALQKEMGITDPEVQRFLNDIKNIASGVIQKTLKEIPKLFPK